MSKPPPSINETLTLPPGGRREGGSYLLRFEQDTCTRVPLPDDGVILIGRGDDVDLRVSDGAASRRHALLTIAAGLARLTDLDSHNGTRINGEPLTEARALASGDVITVGDCVLVVHCAAAVPPAAVARAATRLTVGEYRPVVADPAMTRIFELLRRLAPRDLPVLISGETGVGKELAALALHDWSPRSRRPFVTLNCAALPESLVESELFGYERGAFSGAVAAKPGLLESASGGTVFFDEIGELAPNVQAKLLRAFEAKRITRLGGLTERRIEVRVVAATNRDLEQACRAGSFRQDLFFRLAGATVIVPPLRERSLEVPALARVFLDEACAAAGRSTMAISAAAMQRLASHAWPGNVRELKNAMEYAAAAVTDDTLEPHHLPDRMAPADAAAPPPPGGFVRVSDELRSLERARMLEALEAAGGVQARAAEIIGMPLRTFMYKMKQHKIAGRREK
jgi:DNA-binding NtrC family response regulator